MTCVVQVPPLGQGVRPAVTRHLLGAGLVEHNAKVGQVKHRHQPEHQIDQDHPGAALAVLRKEYICIFRYSIIRMMSCYPLPLLCLLPRPDAGVHDVAELGAEAVLHPGVGAQREQHRGDLAREPVQHRAATHTVSASY